MKTIDILYTMYSQIYVDIFFIDWERPRGSVAVGGGAGGMEGRGQQGGGGVSTPVSVMRTLFVANEWREIQTIRRIKPTFQVYIFCIDSLVKGNLLMHFHKKADSAKKERITKCLLEMQMEYFVRFCQI